GNRDDVAQRVVDDTTVGRDEATRAVDEPTAAAQGVLTGREIDRARTRRVGRVRRSGRYVRVRGLDLAGDRKPRDVSSLVVEVVNRLVVRGVDVYRVDAHSVIEVRDRARDPVVVGSGRAHRDNAGKSHACAEKSSNL